MDREVDIQSCLFWVYGIYLVKDTKHGIHSDV